MAPKESTRNKAKHFKICNAIGGLDVTRLVSTNARNFFSSAIEDVELMREYVSEFAHSGNWTSEFRSLQEMGQTLDWQARGVPNGTTTVQVGLGYADDRPDRRVDRFVGLKNMPSVGDLYSEFAMLDPLSPLLPWLVDRKSKQYAWWKDHMNGRTEGDKKEKFHTQSFYTAAWVGGEADTFMYYPPLSVYGHPLTIGDVVGEQYDSRVDLFITPALPQNNPERKATFAPPYPDVALPGVALITAVAPVYYTGRFQGYNYQDTFVATAGIDIKVSDVSAFLDDLQDALTPNSFGLLVDFNFNTIVISQEVVNRLYPERTGMEEVRVTYDLVDEMVIQDRRNQTYLPSDTILQDLTKLDNANWKGLWEKIQATPQGERAFETLNATLTGQDSPTEFYVMYENWDTVADWTLLVFAPKAEIHKAIQVYTTSEYSSLVGGPDAADPAVSMEGERGVVLEGSSMIVNGGNLDVTLSLSKIPAWVLINDSELFSDDTYTLRSGEFLPIQFQVATSELATGTQSDSIVFDVQDDGYPDCFYSAPVTIPLSVLVTPKDCGDNRIADAEGSCICSPGTVAMNDNCMKAGAVVAAFLIPIVVLACLAFYWYAKHRRRLADSVWEIDPKELAIPVPPVIIGSGSFGQVVLAEYCGSKVAVKTIRRTHISKGSTTESQILHDGGSSKIASFRGSSSLAKRKTHREAFIKEIRMLSRLQHRNIVCVMGAVVKGRSTPSLVLEYMERGSLFDLVRSDTKMDGQLILDILKDVTQGLRFLHNTKPEQVVHGDLKARNVLIDEKLRAKVADFGSGTPGTPYWTSPELLPQRTESTPASDVYALGITVWEMYARATPYQGEEPSVVIQEIKDPKVNKRPPYPPNMQSCVAAMMHDCLLANPEERPTLNELASRINRFNPVDVEYQVEKEESGELGFLKKLFPAHIAKALGGGKTVEPGTHETVTLVYCEIVGFGTLSSELPPIKVTDLLHRLFDRLDALAEEHNVFKVDMSGGGGWMGATNCIQDQVNDHAKRMARFAILAASAAREVLIDEGHPENGHVQIKTALVSGPVQGKVVGRGTPRYSLYGPTVDAVSYLAGHKSEAGCILCADSTQVFLESQAPEIPTQVKARVFVPDMGATTTFWVNPPKEEAFY
ncbi:activated protein kinase catalytic subunit alpha-1 [Seminavis robusta]|uniref:guanylate cyclase n=1 Tax=Seminavis robusta TaxID=568900 RepID=A0A9N8HIU3_9STRA|nr:activated protein kinase catalytic subunit alpha-1 [Seminavis robusta]|eukprot:Sro645_g180610.1 activated protein kinase catalytic subunit alpha-1 (1136) ;mRNA; r:16586-20079